MASKFPKPDNFKPVASYPKAHRYEGKGRCQAWNHNRGQQCEKLAMRGMRVCRTHGGASRKGADHPNYQGKGYSKYLDGRPELLKGHQSWLRDPSRLGVEEETALARALISQDLEQLSKGAPAWNEAQTLFVKARVAINSGKTKDANELLGELGRVLTAGEQSAVAQDRILDNLETVRRLVDTGRQIQVDTGEFMRRGQVIMILSEILQVMRSELAKVPGGRDVLGVVADRFRMLVGPIE